MDGIAAVRARIQQIESQFGTHASSGVLGASAAGATGDPTATATATGTGTGTGTDQSQNSGSFADALSQAQGAPASNATVAAGSGKLNRAGVDSVQWARDFLTKLNMPITSENVRAISAWEQAGGRKA